METTRASLLLRIKDLDDASAWREFDAIYRPIVARYARSRGLSPNDAEDVAQHCLTVVSRKIGEFDYDPQRGKFKGWLRTVVNNHVRNLERGRREEEGDSGAFAGLPEPHPSPDEVFEKLWMEEHLRHALGLLRHEVNESTFRAFQRYVLDERPVEEVCAELNVTPNQVYQSKWRMTQRLSEKMRELLEGTD